MYSVFTNEQLGEMIFRKSPIQTVRMVRLNQVRSYVEAITAEGNHLLGDEYRNSDFSRWVEWADSFLQEHDLKSRELPRNDLLD